MFIVRIICILLVIMIGVTWLTGFISHYKGIKIEMESGWKQEEYTFGDYVYGDSYYGNRSPAFFGAILLIVAGIYMLMSTLLPIKFMTQDRRISLLNQYKSFLDTGVITQEEFDDKKKELLGL